MTVVNGKKIQDLKGTVVSDKSDKTIVVVCENVRKHPLYKKRYVKQKKFFAHDEENKKTSCIKNTRGFEMLPVSCWFANCLSYNMACKGCKQRF